MSNLVLLEWEKGGVIKIINEKKVLIRRIINKKGKELSRPRINHFLKKLQMNLEIILKVQRKARRQ